MSATRCSCRILPITSSTRSSKAFRTGNTGTDEVESVPTAKRKCPRRFCHPTIASRRARLRHSGSSSLKDEQVLLSPYNEARTRSERLSSCSPRNHAERVEHGGRNDSIAHVYDAQRIIDV